MIDEPVRILFAEDLPEDAELALREIARENIRFIHKLVNNEPDFRKYLAEFVPDVIISDYSMPVFDGMSALNIVREHHSYIPFIILTGSTNEETAVRCIKAGANDYVIKEQIKRLPFAVLEAIENGQVKKEKIKAQDQLNLMLQEYQDLINGMKETVWIISPEGRLLDVNNTASEILEYSKPDLIGMGLQGIDKHMTEEKLLCIIQETLNVSTRLYHTFHTTRQGKTIPVEVNSSPIRYQGHPAILMVARDITQRVATEAKLKLLSRSVEDSPVGIVITDRNGYIVFVNSAFTNITGYAQSEAVGKTPRIFKSNQYPYTFYKELWKVITSGKTWRSEIINQRKNGEIFWAEVSISPIFDQQGEITHFVSVHEDISQKKKMIEELIRAKEKAEENDKLKSAFLANLSHEIRTPMNGILGFSNLIRESSSYLPENEPYFQLIQESGDRMLNTLEDIIKISEIETNQVKVSVQEINVSEHIIKLMQFFEPDAHKKNLEMILEDNLHEDERVIYTDVPKFDSIITNLLKNAVKFTLRGYVTVKLDMGGNMLTVAVKDTGIGIPENKLEVIFDRFVQADMSMGRLYEGTGLGLAIAKSYSILMGGDINVESKPGSGSTFFFSLPCNTAKKVMAEQAGINDNSIRLPENLKVLVVEDDHPASVLYKLMLRDKCAELLFARNGEQAVDLVSANPDIDIVLLDLKMPGMNGFIAARRIKDLNNHIKIIAQTACTLAGDKEKALSAGCDDYITKPVDWKKLFYVINKCLYDKRPTQLLK